MSLLDSLLGRERVASNIKTKGDAARAAAKLGQRAVERGLSPQNAAELAAHELSHALEDTSRREQPASMNLGLDLSGNVKHAEYDFDQTDPKNAKKVATAPARSGRSAYPMSDADVEVYENARARDRS